MCYRKERIKMRDELKQAIDFSDKISHISGILQIALYGPIAKGDNGRAKIAIIHELNSFELAKKIEQFRDERIELELINLKDAPKKLALFRAIADEGIILHGRPLTINYDEMKLHPKALVSYKLSNLSQTEKVKINRALYGSKSKSEYKGKKYITQTKGFIAEEGIEKISNSVLLISSSKLQKFSDLFSQFNVQHNILKLWL